MWEWLPRKNLEVFIDVAKCFPDDIFVIVGDGPYREERKRKILLMYFFLFPSESETYGLVVLEVMAKGLHKRLTFL